MQGPFRCPKCAALVTDRRIPICTTCRADLPAEWLLTAEQFTQLTAIDQHARAGHAALLDQLDESKEPDSTTELRLE
jgi:hypothetical protein